MAIILRPRHQYDAPETCIYCGDQHGPFTDEHIIPRNMGGQLVFKNASCKSCEKIINREIETRIGNMTGTFRRRVMPARNRDKKRRPDTYTLEIIHKDTEASQKYILPAAEAPRILYLIKFPLPALFFPEARTEQTYLWSWVHREDLKRIKSQFGGDGYIGGHYDEVAFARQLAKIAHAYVSAEHPAIDSYEKLLPKFILTGVGDYRSLIGCGTAPLDSDTRRWLCNIHWGRVTVGEYAYLISRFRIFAFTNAPVYEVIVARKKLSRGPLEPVYGRPIER